MNEMDEPTTTVTLHALEGQPLVDEALRSMVMASALAIAERQGVRVIHLEATRASVTATLIGERIVGIGFAAELRRITEQWHADKHGGASLWGEVRHDEGAPPGAEPDAEFGSGFDAGGGGRGGWGDDDIDDADWWKQA